MLRTMLERLALGVLTLLAVSALIFAATEILPGDVASTVLGQGATPEALQVFRQELGLDRPALERYGQWLSGALHGELGRSMTNQRAITLELLPRFANTLMLAAMAALIAVPLSVGLGIVSAIHENTWVDKLANVLTLMTITVPEFFIAYVLILVFAVHLDWLPSLATVFEDMSLSERLYVTALPAMTLTLLVAAHMLRMTRASILAIMAQPYIEMAFIKGLPRRQVVWRHALPNAAAPIISIVALNLAYLVVGVVVIEVVFVYPGMGQWMVDAVAKRDLPVVQACGLIFAGVFVLLNTAADLLTLGINPRLRQPRP